MPFTSSHSAIYFGLLICCLLLGGGLIISAWRRPQQRQRWLRVLAGIVAAGALWLAAYPPVRHLPATHAEAIVLTDGFAPDTLRQLQLRLGSGTPVWYYGQGPAPANARPLSSLLTLAEQQPALHQVHVLGQGLTATELPTLGLPIRLHPGATFSSFRTAFWNHQLALGERLNVDGMVEPIKGKAPIWASLRAAGAVRDSVTVRPDGSFRLQYQPKTAGLATYELVLRQNSRQLTTEPVPVAISTPPLPAVLLISATPSFEYKFLKNHLAEARYPVALRTGISRGLVQTDFVNQPTAALDRLTPALLARYGVLVADAASLASLSAAENQTLQAAIRAGRLGLVVLAEAAPLPRTVPARADFAVLPRAAQPAPVLLTWPGASAEARTPLPAQLQLAPNLHSLATAANGALVAASRRLGLGFVVVSVVPTTFQWALQGHTPVYASFWNRLLTAAVPPTPTAATWRVAAQWPRLRQPLTLQLAAAFPEQMPTVRALASGPAVRLALRQDTRLPEWSTAQLWPEAAGWHELLGPGATKQYFYVYPDSAWRGPELRERQQAAAQWAVRATASSATAKVLEPWPAGWFFALFLLATGYLWLEEKL